MSSSSDSATAEAVRGPARAAGLTWEADSTTKEPLDDRLIRDIDRPDLLALVGNQAVALVEKQDAKLFVAYSCLVVRSKFI